MDRVPTGMENLVTSCLQVNYSKFQYRCHDAVLLAHGCCWSSVMFTRMKWSSDASLAQRSPSSMGSDPALRSSSVTGCREFSDWCNSRGKVELMRRMYAVNVHWNFYSAKMAKSPSYDIVCWWCDPVLVVAPDLIICFCCCCHVWWCLLLVLQAYLLWLCWCLLSLLELTPDELDRPGAKTKMLKPLMCFTDACSSWLLMYCSDALKGPIDEPRCQGTVDVQECLNPDVHWWGARLPWMHVC